MCKVISHRRKKTMNHREFTAKLAPVLTLMTEEMHAAGLFLNRKMQEECDREQRIWSLRLKNTNMLCPVVEPSA